MLKKIGIAARLDIEKMVGTKVFLELFVKVSRGGAIHGSLSKNWTGGGNSSQMAGPRPEK